MSSFFSKIANEFKTSSVDWLKSHSIMSAIVFALLLAGLSIINYKIVDFGNFAGIFFIALGLALLDFLPVIGLFAPMSIWAAVAILQSKNTLGISIIVLCFIVMIIKEILEPFIIGKSMGISPLEEILSCVVGYLVLGTNAIGFIVGPIVYTVGKTVYLKVTHQPLVRDAKKPFFNRKNHDTDDVIDISDDVEDVDDNE